MTPMDADPSVRRRLLWNTLPIALATAAFVVVYEINTYRYNIDPLRYPESLSAATIHAWGAVVVTLSAFVALSLSSLVISLRGHRFMSVIPAAMVALAPLDRGAITPYFENWSLKAPAWLPEEVAIGVAMLIVIPALLARPSPAKQDSAVDPDVWRRCVLLCALAGLGLVIADDNIGLKLVDPQVHAEALVSVFLVGASTRAWKTQWEMNLLLAFLLSPFISSMLMPMFGDVIYWRWGIGGLVGFIVILAVGSASHPLAARWSHRAAPAAAVDGGL